MIISRHHAKNKNNSLTTHAHKKINLQIRSLTPARLANLFLFALDLICPRKNGEARSLPINIGIHLNGICNIRCDHCFYDWQNAPFIKRNIPLEKFEELLDSSLASRILRVAFAGGEPLMHPQWPELVKACKRRRLTVSLHTNGTLLDKYLDRICESGLDYLNISMYDQVWDDVKPQAKALLQALRRQGAQTEVSLTKVITHGNLDDALGAVDQAKEIGIGRVWLQNYYTNDRSQLKDVLRDTPKVRNLLQKAKKAAERQGIVLMPPTLLKDGPQHRNSACLNVISSPVVDEEGKLAPCCFLAPPTDPEINLSLPNVLNVKKIRELRKALRLGSNAVPPSCRYCSYRNNYFFKFF